MYLVKKTVEISMSTDYAVGMIKKQSRKVPVGRPARKPVYCREARQEWY